MPDQQPHTPTTRGVRTAYLRMWSGQIQGANAETVAAEFDRWHKKVIAAAEQRGAENAVQVIRQEAKDAVGYEWPYPDDHLHDIAKFIEDKYRADQEGDDE